MALTVLRGHPVTGGKRRIRSSCTYAAGRTGLGPMTSRKIGQWPTSQFVHTFGAPPRRDRRTGNIIARTSRVVDTARLLPRFSIRVTRVTATRYLMRMRRSHNNHDLSKENRSLSGKDRQQSYSPFSSRAARISRVSHDFSRRTRVENREQTPKVEAERRSQLKMFCANIIIISNYRCME